MSKTPDYTKKAIKKYQSKLEVITLRLPKGMKERIKAHTNLSLNAYIFQLIKNDLPDEIQQDKKEIPEQAETQKNTYYEPEFTYDEYGNAYCVSSEDDDDLPFWHIENNYAFLLLTRWFFGGTLFLT